MKTKQLVPKLRNTSIEDQFKKEMITGCDLAGKFFHSDSERDAWINQQWITYRDDIEEYLAGCLDDPDEYDSYEFEQVEIIDAILANSEGIFGERLQL